MGRLSFCLWAVVYLSLLRPVVCRSLAYVIRAVVSARIIVGWVALCLPYSDGRATGVTRWLGWSQGKLHSGKIHRLIVVASYLAIEPSGTQQWQQATWEGVRLC